MTMYYCLNLRPCLFNQVNHNPYCVELCQLQHFQGRTISSYFNTKYNLNKCARSITFVCDKLDIMYPGN